MNSLREPSGWALTSIGEILNVVRGGSPRPKGDPRYFGGKIPWIMIADVTAEKGKFISKTRDSVTEEGAKKSRLLSKGTLILTNSATVCVPKILAVDGCIHDGFVAFPELSKNLEILYLFYYFDYIRSKIIQQNRQGITQVNLNIDIVKNIPLYLSPLPEQRRIIIKIEELLTQLDAGVASLKKVQAQLKRYRQAVLKSAFEGRLTQEWREKHKGEIEPAGILLENIKNEFNRTKGINTDPKNLTNLPLLPQKWIWTTFSSVGNWSGGGTPSTLVNKYWDGDILWITSKDMKVLKIFNSELKITPDGVENSAAKMIPSGSLLFVVRSGILLRTLPVALNMVDATVNQDLKVLIPSKKINNEFLLWIAIAFGDNIRHNCAKDGTTVQSINIPALREFSIPLAPKEEQDEIVAQIEKNMSIVDEIELTITTSLRQAKTLRQSILKRAFEGKLVPQDPTDESASILLERIKAEKAHHAAEPKKGKTLQPKSTKRKVPNGN